MNSRPVRRIPLFASKKDSPSTAELIFETLLQNQPLNIGQIRESLRAQRRCRLSYQAVRKAVKKLLAQAVLEQLPGGYQLNKGWLLSARSALDGAIQKYYAPEKRLAYRPDREYQSFLCHSLYELDSLWGELLLDICSRTPKSGRGLVLSLNHYAFWMPFNISRETELYPRLIKLGFAVKFVFSKRCALNRWAGRLYGSIGVGFEVIPGLSIEADRYFNVIGQNIIQADLPASTTADITRLFSRKRRIEDFTAAELKNLAHASPRKPIKLTIFENSSLADLLRRQAG